MRHLATTGNGTESLGVLLFWWAYESNLITFYGFYVCVLLVAIQHFTEDSIPTMIMLI